MSKLEELIQKYCPDGVEYKALKDVCTDFIVPMRDRPKVFDGDIPWCRIEDKQGQYFNGSLSGLGVSEKVIKQMNLKVFPTGTVICSCSASLGSYAINTRPLITNQTFIGIVCGELLFNKYLLYFMETQTAKLISLSNSGTIPYISRKKFEELEIPTPPLPVQEEIVRVLDTFTELQSELQTELPKRRQQFEYYQDYLLNKSQFSHLISIGDICDIKKGNTPIQKAREGDYPLVVTTMERRSSDTYQFNANAVCIPLISSRGHGVASLNHVYYQEGKFALGNILCAVIPHEENVLKAKFLYYYLEYAKDYTLVPLMKGGANVSMHCSDIEKVKIPLPPIDEQERIITILDKFDALTNDLTTGLPAEIEKRRQQYEYYRDKLLTFKRN